MLCCTSSADSSIAVADVLFFLLTQQLHLTVTPSRIRLQPGHMLSANQPHRSQHHQLSLHNLLVCSRVDDSPSGSLTFSQTSVTYSTDINHTSHWPHPGPLTIIIRCPTSSVILPVVILKSTLNCRQYFLWGGFYKTNLFASDFPFDLLDFLGAQDQHAVLEAAHLAWGAWGAWARSCGHLLLVPGGGGRQQRKCEV